MARFPVVLCLFLRAAFFLGSLAFSSHRLASSLYSPLPTRRDAIFARGQFAPPLSQAWLSYCHGTRIKWNKRFLLRFYVCSGSEFWVGRGRRATCQVRSRWERPSRELVSHPPNFIRLWKSPTCHQTGMKIYRLVWMGTGPLWSSEPPKIFCTLSRTDRDWSSRSVGGRRKSRETLETEAVIGSLNEHRFKIVQLVWVRRVNGIGEPAR